jgi:hypothetical protein
VIAAETEGGPFARRRRRHRLLPRGSRRHRRGRLRGSGGRPPRLPSRVGGRTSQRERAVRAPRPRCRCRPAAPQTYPSRARPRAGSGPPPPSRRAESRPSPPRAVGAGAPTPTRTRTCGTGRSPVRRSPHPSKPGAALGASPSAPCAAKGREREPLGARRGLSHRPWRHPPPCCGSAPRDASVCRPVMPQRAQAGRDGDRRHREQTRIKNGGTRAGTRP